uniref:Uncharacterized protein n=1 Tax=Chaetophora sp. FACHB-2423 TaxID=2725789 RepID=A0A6H1XE02_9CHLO|nr:hypothetical protein [Chaetophora sp. FACHB-2423]
MAKSLERKMGKRKSEERKSEAFPFFAFSFSPRKNLQFFLVSCVKDSQYRVLNTRKFSLSWRLFRSQERKSEALVFPGNEKLEKLEKLEKNWKFFSWTHSFHFSV